MCGIFGYAGKTSPDKSYLLHYLMHNLAISSEVRGVDSTGFAARFSNGKSVVDKLPLRASHFVDMSYKFRMLEKSMPDTFIGHTRLGTGSDPVINNNNHPFIGKDYHMVHNGVIPSWKDIKKKHSVDMTSETDSEIVLRLLEKQKGELGFRRSVEWVLNNIWGNMAIALLDKNNPHIWLFRNENPIHVFVVNKKVFGGDVIIFCSTQTIFESAWKSLFKKKPSKKLVSSHFLNDNRLFKISTRGKDVNGSLEKFMVYNLDVNKKFVRKKQYYGSTVGATDSHGRYAATTSKAKTFLSKLVDVNDVSKGCDFTDKQKKELSKVAAEKNAVIEIDGMNIQEYSALKTFSNNIIVLERAILRESTLRASASNN